MNKNGRSGDMFCTYEEAMRSIKEVLGADVKIEEFPVTRSIKLYDDNTITTAEKHSHDHGIATQIVNMVNSKPLKVFSGFDWTEQAIQSFADFDLDLGQIAAIQQVAKSRVSIVTGAPGTGKTSGVVNPLLKIAKSIGLSVVLSAPTGKAAVVMQAYSGHEADTNHMNFMLFDPGAADWPGAEADLVILDETSMLPSKELDLLLSRIGNSHVVFVGDPWQLPPVGSGEPLLQIIESGLVPHVELKTIHRQSAGNGLIEAIHAIKAGRAPSANPDFDTLLIKEEHKVHTVEKRVDWYREKHNCGIEDIMIVTPLNDHRTAINKHFQKKYAKQDAPVTPDGKYHLGDKVIHLKNNRALGRRGVMNGEVGFVAYVDEEDMVVSYPGKTGDVVYPYDDICYVEQLDLAYAMTVHKSQGDQARFVIAYFPAFKSDHPLSLRQLWYVATSRGQERGSCYYSGDPMSYIGNEKRMRRRSKLAQFMQENSHV
jgi:exodeoxyribonuclease V alpha subunit